MNEQHHKFKVGDLVIVACAEYTALAGIIGSHALVMEYFPPTEPYWTKRFRVIANGSTHMLYESELDGQ